LCYLTNNFEPVYSKVIKGGGDAEPVSSKDIKGDTDRRTDRQTDRQKGE